MAFIKTALFILLLQAVLLPCFAQTDPWETSFARSLCNCYTKTRLAKTDDMEDCLKKTWQGTSLPIALQKKYEKDSDGLLRFIVSVNDKMSIDLIYSCDFYYQQLDSFIFYGVFENNIDSVQNIIQQMFMPVSQTSKKEFFSVRATLYLKIKKTDEALDDANLAVAIDSAYTPAQYIRAIALTRKGEYNAAADAFARLVPSQMTPSMQMAYAVFKRKNKMPTSR